MSHALKKDQEATAASPVAMMTAQTEMAINLAKANFEQIAAKSREAMEQSLKAVGSVTEMARGNVDALLESSRVASGGFVAIAQEVAEFSKQSMERTTRAARILSVAKTAPELIQLQSEFARTEFTTAIAEASKLSQDMFKTMTAIFEPLQRHAIAAAQVKDIFED
jgi:hypothetical protein